jgi:hypothetical protein
VLDELVRLMTNREDLGGLSDEEIVTAIVEARERTVVQVGLILVAVPEQVSHVGEFVFDLLQRGQVDYLSSLLEEFGASGEELVVGVDDELGFHRAASASMSRSNRQHPQSGLVQAPAPWGVGTWTVSGCEQAQITGISSVDGPQEHGPDGVVGCPVIFLVEAGVGADLLRCGVAVAAPGGVGEVHAGFGFGERGKSRCPRRPSRG